MAWFKKDSFDKIVQKGVHPNFMELQSQLFALFKMWYTSEKKIREEDSMITGSPFLPDELRKISMLALICPMDYSGRDELDILMKLLEDRNFSYSGLRFKELVIDIYATFDPLFLIAYKHRIETSFVTLKLIPVPEEKLKEQLEKINMVAPWYWLVQPYQQAIGIYELDH